jgi:RES domain-containing protein
VYAAPSVALAALERLIYYDFDPAADLYPRQHLSTALQERGDTWYASQRTSGGVVPSAHVPEEPNLLLNPTHHDFPRIAIEYVREFHYVPRLPGRLHESSDA